MLVQWGRTFLGWSPRGYIINIQIWVEERALHECATELQQAIDDALADSEVVGAIELTPMVKTRDSSGSRADPGELEILTRRLIDPDGARRLREAVNTVLADAVEKAHRDGDADEKQAEQVRAVFRESAD